MSAPEITFPSLARGFNFHAMTVFAQSWAAFDSLPECDGWVERELHHPEGYATPYKTLGPWPSGYIAVHPPREPRPETVQVGERQVTARLATVPPVTPEEDEAWAGWTSTANGGAA